jgi:ATP-binding cassette subfamily B protein
MMRNFPFYQQLNENDCGPACIRMICRFYKKIYSSEYIRRKCYVTKSGVSLWHLSNAAGELGFRTLYAKVKLEDLADAATPSIVHWNGHHFIVVCEIRKSKVIVADPAIGILTYTIAEFKKNWIHHNDDEKGIVLLLEPTPNFYQDETTETSKIGFSFFVQYLKPFKKYYIQLLLAMVAGMGFSLMMPFLLQSTIDFGVNNKNIAFINLILLAQIMLTISSTCITYIQSWIFLHIGARINISIISDYLIKLLKLPIPFFDTRTSGDIIQRISDHSRVQSFISSTTLSSIFSVVNFIVFSFIMAYYSLKILIISILFSIMFAIWIVFFLKKRRQFDYKQFANNSLKQTNLFQLISGIRDIKLHNYEDKKRWEWERIQIGSFKINIKQLTLSQYQSGGALFIETSKNMLISWLAAKSVIDGQMTLGMMISMQYILGQVNGPISFFTSLINSYQDARISLERIGDIHSLENEEQENALYHTDLPEKRNIRLEHVFFKFDPHARDYILKDISFEIPQGKVTAIVGPSGCGKTTLLKLLLKFYTPTEGKIMVGDVHLNNLGFKHWRDYCGSVLQDGYIFPDTILENISLGDENLNIRWLEKVVRLANIDSFIYSLPMGFNTKIGPDGVGVSQGQRQRLLIARAIYKDPQYLFLDEATNSLDANNESVILTNLEEQFREKTVVIIAHRLATIKSADQIVVMENGSVKEIGTHTDLLSRQGVYSNLVKKQSEPILF